MLKERDLEGKRILCTGVGGLPRVRRGRARSATASSRPSKQTHAAKAGGNSVDRSHELNQPGLFVSASHPNDEAK
jgi:hypothetical protein